MSTSNSKPRPRPRPLSNPRANNQTKKNASKPRSQSRNLNNTVDPHEKVIRDLMAQNDSLKKILKKCNDEKEKLEKINEKNQLHIDKDKQAFIKLTKEKSRCDRELLEAKSRITYLESEQTKLKLRELNKTMLPSELRELSISSSRSRR
jgi:predicted RNase H-like nuclease (RuvC/YqgF family)